MRRDSLRVVDVLDAGMEANALAGVPQLLHAVVQILRVELVLRVSVAGVQRRAVHSDVITTITCDCGAHAQHKYQTARVSVIASQRARQFYM